MSHYYPSPYYAQPQIYYEQEPQPQQWENMYCKQEILEVPMPVYYDPLPSPPYTPNYIINSNQQSYFSPMEYIPRTEPLEASWPSSPISSPCGSTHSNHSLPAIRVELPKVEVIERRSSDINIVYGNYTHSSVLQAPIQLAAPATRIPIVSCLFLFSHPRFVFLFN